MQSFVITLLTCSVTMSALALFYMAITPLLARRYSEKGRYYAWLIIVIGLIIPFRPQFSNAIVKVDMPSETATPIVQIGNGTPVAIPDVNTALPSALPSISWWQVAAAVWLAGMIAFLAYHVIKHCIFAKMAKRWSENIIDEQALTLFQSLKTEMGISKRVNLYLCSCVGSPMMIGFVNPRILLPKADLAHDELRFILKHELVHYKRKDLLYKYLVLVATAVHWFNPVVHLMVKAIDLLCETSCDAEVIRSTDADTRQHYTEAIIGVVKYQSKLKTTLSTNFYGGKKGMKNRIASIMDTGKKRAGFAIVCIVLIATMGTGFAFAANASPSANGQSSQSSGTPVSPQEQAKIDQQLKQKIANQYAVYEKYGLSYDQTTDTFYFDGKTVLFFADKLDNDGTYVSFTRDTGEVGLNAVRNADNELIGVAPVSQEEFERMSVSINAAKGIADGTYAENSTNENASIPNATQIATENETGNGNIEEGYASSFDPDYVDDSLNEYLAYGISYDKANSQWLYDNKPIHFLTDGDNLTYINNDENVIGNGISLKVMRDSNGKIEKLSEMTMDEMNSALN